MKGWKLPPEASRYLPYFLIVITTIFVFALRLPPEPSIYDDAYITFRYARNLAEGQGFVYNAGERVLGTSTPLYAMILACGAKIFGSDALPWFATRLNVLCDAIGVALIFLIARRLKTGSAVAFGIALVFATNPISAMNSLAGMETSFYIMFLLATAYALLAKRLTALGILSAILILTRPDGLIFAGLAGFAAVFQHRKFDRKAIHGLVAFALPLLIWITFSLFYFGSIFPQTMAAKQLAYPNRFPWWHLARDFVYHAGDCLFSLFGLQLRGYGSIYGILFIFGLVQAIRTQRAAWAIALFPLIYALAFSFGAPMLFQWYVVPPIPFWQITGTLGLLGILLVLFKRIPKTTHSQQRFVAQTLVFILLLVSVQAQLKKYNRSYGTFQPPWPHENREDTYRAVAELLSETIPASARVATPEIGTFGFFHPARILDTVGLVSPEAMQFYPLPLHQFKWNSSIPPRLIQNEKPDFVVAFDGFMRNSLLKSPCFLHGYREIKSFPYQLWESTGPQVYERRSLKEIETDFKKSKTLFLDGRYKDAMNSIQDSLYYDNNSREEALQFLNEGPLMQLMEFSPDPKRVKPGFFCDFEPIKDENGVWYILDQWGRVYRSQSGSIQIFTSVSLVDLDVVASDLEQTPWGWIVVDSAGYLYPLDSTKTLPKWTAIESDQEINQCVAFKYSPAEEGFYLLDMNGRLHWRGKTPKPELTDQKRLWKQPVARDFVISDDGQHFYLVNSHGVVVHQGPEAGAIEPSQTYNWGQDIVRRVEFIPGQNALALLTGNGDIYLYSNQTQDFDSQLPDPGWNYLVAFNFQPETERIMAMDSNGKIYSSIPVSMSRNDVSSH